MDKELGVNEFGQSILERAKLLTNISILQALNMGIIPKIDAKIVSIQEVHIIEPKWSDVRITQVIGRSIRELGRN